MNAPANGQALAVKTPSVELTSFSDLRFSDVITKEELQRMPMGLRIEFVPQLKQQFTEMAEGMAASPLTREHLQGNVPACYAVIKNALNWRMDPFQVAAKTYSPAKGQVAIEGVLASAIMLNSGRIEDLTYEYLGDWEQVRGKWAYEQLTWPNGNPKKYKDGNPIMGNVAKWTPDDEKGLGIVGIATMKTGRQIRTPDIMLSQCHPRNAQTWPVAPDRQIIHVAERALCNMTCGDILMGVHIDVGLTRHFDEPQERQPPRNITPAAIDPLQDVQGKGETEPYQEGGVTDVPDDRQWTADEQAKAKAQQAEPVQTDRKKRSPRVSIEFRGKQLYKTGFMRDLPQEISRCEYLDELEALQREATLAIEASSDPSAFEDVGPLFDKARAEFDDSDGDEAPADGGVDLS